MSDLMRDTAPVARGGGVHAIELPDAWDFLLPSGGVLQTASLRAAAAELGDPGLRLVSATTIFCTPLRPGTLIARATVLRRGGAAAQVRVDLRHEGSDDAGLETIATFARDREGPDVVGMRFPDVPAPLDCPDVVDEATHNAHRHVRFFVKNFECRLAAGPRIWQPGWSAGPARYARWFRYLTPPVEDGRLARAAHAPIADTMPPALAAALGPSSYRYFAPSLDLTLHVLDDTDREWLLAAVHLQRARAGTATADVTIWDDQRRLLARGTQTMFIRTVSGTPPAGPLVAE